MGEGDFTRLQGANDPQAESPAPLAIAQSNVTSSLVDPAAPRQRARYLPSGGSLKILGVHDGHNASACLVEDGLVRAALQEERLSRTKNEYRFPRLAIEWILDSTGTDPGDLDLVAMHANHVAYPRTRDQTLDTYGASQTLRAWGIRTLKRTPVNALFRRRRKASRLSDVRSAGLPTDKAVFVDHHTAHAAVAYHGSPWDTEPVLVLTADGMGDGLSASVRVGQGGKLAPPIATVADSHSVGSVYAKVTYALGMVPNEHEYKLMGMAPYAPEEGRQACFELFRNLFEFESGGLSWKRRPGVPHTFYNYHFVRDLLERQRFDCVAAGLQKFTEEHLVAWTRQAIEHTGIRKVALGGGVFMNVKANKRIYELPELEGLFVAPSCGDETNCVGAAFQAYADARASIGRPVNIRCVDDVYWGPSPSDESVQRMIPELRARGYRVERPEDVEARVGDLLAEGAIVARAAGPMEFGARALGNRSILADPTRTDVVRTINDMIKNRDFWMPFAPAMLAERSAEYVVNPKGIDAPFMMMTFDTTDRVDDFPAGVQPYDRTARPQFVRSDRNAPFHRIISRFQERTGRSVVLNTSFNLHGFPIVCSAEDAVQVFESSGLEHLSVASYLISKT